MQQITITEGKGAVASEIKDVLSFSDREIRIATRDNKKIVFCGSALKIGGFSKASGELSVEGAVSSVRYQGANESIIKRVFK